MYFIGLIKDVGVLQRHRGCYDKVTANRITLADPCGVISGSAGPCGCSAGPCGSLELQEALEVFDVVEHCVRQRRFKPLRSCASVAGSSGNDWERRLRKTGKGVRTFVERVRFIGCWTLVVPIMWSADS